MFDTIKLECEIPHPAMQEEEFQTKSLDCELGRFKITKDLRLQKQFRTWRETGQTYIDPFLKTEWPIREVDQEWWENWPETRVLRVYTSTGDHRGTSDFQWYEYEIELFRGRVTRFSIVEGPGHDRKEPSVDMHITIPGEPPRTYSRVPEWLKQMTNRKEILDYVEDLNRQLEEAQDSDGQAD